MPGKLFTPFVLGDLQLKNRVVMAPMTRCRAPGNVPAKSVGAYYAQRSEAGLIITEGTAPSPNGLGYPRIPGIFNTEQVSGWRKVTQAVHDGGGRIFVQLMHTGRVGHPENLPDEARLLAPSAIAAPGEMFTDTKGPLPHPVPAAMDARDLHGAIDSFVQAALLAVNHAGFDGVELHGANGYLIDQFLNTASNARSDEWGSSVEGRVRFAVETARRVAETVGNNRVGMRISPFGVFNGMTPDDQMIPLYESLVDQLSGLGLAYLHMVDHSSLGAPALPAGLRQNLRQRFAGAFILSGGYDKVRAGEDLDSDNGDLVAFGRPFIANPRLVTRLRDETPLAAPDDKLFYTGGDEGYIDHPE